jgi:hypothetical protein
MIDVVIDGIPCATQDAIHFATDVTIEEMTVVIV